MVAMPGSKALSCGQKKGNGVKYAGYSSQFTLDAVGQERRVTTQEGFQPRSDLDI